MKSLNKKNSVTRNDTTSETTQQITKKDRLDWISKIKVAPVAILAGASLLAATAMYVNYSNNLDTNRQKIAYISDLRQLSERIEKSAIQVRTADKSAFEELEKSKNNIDKLLNVLQKGGKIREEDTTIPGISGVFVEKFNKVVKDWNDNKFLINTLIEQKVNLTTLKTEVEKIKIQNDKISDLTIIAEKALESQSKNQSTIGQELFLINNRIVAGLDDLFTGESFSLEKGYSLIKDLRQFKYFLTSLQNGNEELELNSITDETTLKALKNLDVATSGYVTIALKITPQIGNLFSAKDVAKDVSVSSKEITSTAQELNSAFTSEVGSLSIYSTISILLFALGVICSALLALVFYERGLQASKLAAHFKKNQNNQKAVDDLLDQLMPLDTGDFTQIIHVEDKFVTPISDRFDATRKKFGDIVKQVKFTSDEVFNSSKSTEETSQKLLEVSSKQYDKLGESIDKIGKLSNEMDELAQVTFLAQEESNSSREASIKGEALVKQSIQKMDEIRNTIQESSKKIKKLGESAQSITEVTGLIQDITKQINVLALNAAIQAASSGESGREFTIVAQEVQRLAFDSESATKKIAEIISEIQSDTAVAVSSMEKTTQEVVIGAQLTDKAGDALKEIEKLADSVANRVADAADQLSQKSSDMATVAIEMKDLQVITENSGNIIKLAASQVEALKVISEKLELSVNSYKVE